MKKITSLLLAFALAFGLTGVVLPVNAADSYATRQQVKEMFETKQIAVTWEGRGGDEGMAWSSYITRAEVATLITRAANLKVNGENPFSDVQPGYWYYEAVVAAATNMADGENAKTPYFIGHGDGTFTPDENILLSEVEILASRLMDADDEERDILDIFNDANVASVVKNNDWVTYVLTEDSSVIKDTTLRTNEEIDASAIELTIDKGVTLTLDKNSTIYANELVVKGTLFVKSDRAVATIGTLTIEKDGVVIIGEDVDARDGDLTIGNYAELKGTYKMYGKADSVADVNYLVDNDLFNKETGKYIIYPSAVIDELVDDVDLLNGDITIKFTKKTDVMPSYYLNGDADILVEAEFGYLNNDYVDLYINGILTAPTFTELSTLFAAVRDQYMLASKKIIVVDAATVSGYCENGEACEDTVTFSVTRDSKVDLEGAPHANVPVKGHKDKITTDDYLKILGGSSSGTVTIVN